jgi:hypothetical protein
MHMALYPFQTLGLVTSQHTGAYYAYCTNVGLLASVFFAGCSLDIYLELQNEWMIEEKGEKSER